MERSARWMGIAGWGYVGVGLAFAVVSLEPEVLRWIAALALPGAGPVDRTAQLFSGIAGGLTAGFGATMVVGARLEAAVRSGVARAIAAGLLAWFVVDSAASALHGSWQNVIGNLAFLALGLPPALALAGRASHAALDRASVRVAG